MNLRKQLLEILYEDKSLLVVNKPSGITVARERENQRKSLMDLLVEIHPELKQAGQYPRYGLVHRLDKETSGVLLIAKNNKTLSFLQKQFQKREVKKTYLALVYGKIFKDKGEIRSLIGRDKNNRLKQKAYLPIEPQAKKMKLREAVTFWEIKERFDQFTLLKVFPKTGRKHQIRVHLAFLGYPIVGDKLYASGNVYPFSRLFLHCQEIIIKILRGKHKKFLASLPRELSVFLNKLK